MPEVRCQKSETEGQLATDLPAREPADKSEQNGNCVKGPGLGGSFRLR